MKDFTSIFIRFLPGMLLMVAVAMLFLPFLAQAQGLVPCQPEFNPETGLVENTCEVCDIFKLFQRVLNFIFIQVTLPLAALLFIVGGFFLIMGGANPQMRERGKTVMTGTVIGLLIILLSWAVINLLMNAFANTGVFPWPWNEIDCG